MDPRRWGPVTVWVAGMVVCGAGQWSAQAAPNGRLPAARVNDEAKESKETQATAGVGVFAKADRKLKQQLHLSRQLLSEGRYAEAVRYLDEILRTPEDYFLLEEKADASPGLKSEAQRLLGAMPREGRELYELQYGPEARQMLSRAVAEGDANGLAEVSRRFFHTRAGYEATLLLGMHHLDRGSPLAGALTLKRLHSFPAAAEQFEPGLSVAMAACWQRAGMPEKAEAVLKAIRERFPRANLRVAGAEVALGGDPAKLIGSNPDVQIRTPDSQPWTMLHGNPARNASTSGGGPLLSLTWRVPTSAEHPHVEEYVDEIQKAYRQQDEWALPALHPLAVNDVVLMRTVRNLRAVDFVTGKLVWEVPNDDPFETAAETQNDSPFVPSQTFDVRTSLRYRLWGDAAYGTLSSDGQRVFAIEDLSLDVSIAPVNQFMFNPRESKPDSRAFNRLAAYDVRSGKLAWHLGGAPGDPGLPQSGAFFLGPPLPLTGQLYVLAETKGEIRLVALDAATGGLQWTQQLAVVDQDRDVLSDPLRRLAGVSPSYADGVLVCPTSNRSVVALELATRSLLWGYAYAENQDPNAAQGPFFGSRPPSSEADPASRWSDSSVTIAEGRVLMTPVDSNELHCLNLIDGKVLWKKPREENLYLACVTAGKVVLVGRHGVRAFALADGEPAWDGRTVDFPSGSLPSGTGFLSDGRYYVPLSSGQVVAVDVQTGAAAHTYRSRRGAVPGNLVCYRGRIISQRADAVELFYQLDSLRRKVENRLAANPDDPEALAQEGEILWDEGKLDVAIAALRRAFERAPGPSNRNLLREAWFDGLRGDFATYRKQSDDIQKLLDDPQHQKTFLRLMAAGYEGAGEYRTALEHYARLIEFDRQQRDMESLDKNHLVRGDRWIRVQLAALRTIAPREIQAEIDKLAQAELASALKTNTVESLQQYLDYFGDLPVADRARWQLVDKYRQSKRFLQAELVLRRLERSDDRGQSARAVGELASLLRQARLSEHAALVYQRLERELGDVVCVDGKTGRQVVEALPADDPVRKFLKAEEAWPKGKVAVTKQRQTTQIPPAFTTAVVPTPEGRGVFFDETNFEVHQSNQVLIARDGWGVQRWQMPVGELMRQERFSIHSGTLRGTFQDHLLLLSIGSRIVAIDTFGTAGGGAPTQLWSQDFDQPRRAPAGGRSARARAMAMRGFPQFQPYGSSSPLYVPVAVSEQLLCYQRFHQLQGVDPATGQVLWVREDVRPDSTVFGDEQYVFVVPPEQDREKSPEAPSQAMMLRAGDGKLLGTRKMPRGMQATLGRRALVWRGTGESDPFATDQPSAPPKAEDHSVLELIDLATEKAVWPPRKFSPDARFGLLEREAAGVFEPSGRFLLVNLADGRTLVDAKVLPERAVADIYLFHGPAGYQLVVNGLERTGNRVTQIYGMHGVPGVQITRARVYGFGLDGKKLWEQPAVVEDQFLLTTQPNRLPLLLFACGTHQRVGNSIGQQRVALVGIDKRTGRVVQPKESPMASSNLRLVGNPEKKTVEVQLQQEVVTMAFTDQAPDPESAAEKASATSALWKALQKAAGGRRPEPLPEKDPAR